MPILQTVREEKDGVYKSLNRTVKSTSLVCKTSQRQSKTFSPNINLHNYNYEQHRAKTPFIDFKNPLNTNVYKNTNMPCDNAVTVIMLIPVSCTGYIIGKKGRTIQEISQMCKANIKIDTKCVVEPCREFRVLISGKILNCKKAMKKILQLIRKVNFYKQYALKIVIDSLYLPHIIGREGKFINKIKMTSKAAMVKVFSTWPNNNNDAVLVIKHHKIYGCLKAAGMALHKVRSIKAFQLGKFRANCKVIQPKQKVMTKHVTHINQKPVSEGPPCLHINTSNEKEVTKASEIKKIALNEQSVVENTTENSFVKPEKQCDKLSLSNVTSITTEDNIKTASFPKINDDTDISHILEANLAKKLGHVLLSLVRFSLKSSFY